MVYQHVEPSNCVKFNKVVNPNIDKDMRQLQRCISFNPDLIGNYRTKCLSFRYNPMAVMEQNIRKKGDYVLEDVINWDTLTQSLEECKRGHMWKDSMVQFDAYSDYNIEEMLNSIYSKKYRFAPLYHTYINERGKTRLISSLTARDRVLQKALNRNFLLPAFRPILVNENCASLEGRGISYAMDKFKHQLSGAYNKWGTNFYILKCDIKSYFDSISHYYIYDLLQQFTSDDRLLYLFESILRGYYFDSYIHNGERVPYGIGLGGEVPQTFGLICLNELDHMIKEELGLSLVRYMDDFNMTSDSYEYLLSCWSFISKYLARIGLQLNANKTNIIPANEGVVFLKFHYYVKDTGKIVLIADKTNRLREQRKLKKMSGLLKDEVIQYSDVVCSYNSWKGHIGKGNDKYLLDYMNSLYDSLFISDFAHGLL